LSRVAGPKALPQRPGWRCGDQSQWMGPRSYLLWEWRPDAARPLSHGGVAGFECLRTASGWAAEPFVLCAEGRPRARREMRHRSRVDPLPSSEAENELPARGYIRYPRARRRLVFCTGVVSLSSSETEIAQRNREGPSNEAEIVQWVRGECEWAARWASLSPFLSSGREAGRGPSWAQLL